jgi:hypothetical protein
MSAADLIALAFVLAWCALVGAGLWLDLPAWIADAESEDDR